VKGTKGVTLVPYKLRELIATIADGKTVFITEGEKCVDIIRNRFDLTATTNPGGTGNGKIWKATSFNRQFKDANVVILPDRDLDGVGLQHAESIVRALRGIARSRRVIDLSADIVLPPKGDIEQWIDLGGTKERLLELVEAAPEYELEDVREPAPGTEPPDDNFIRNEIGQIVRGHPHNVRLAIQKLGVEIRHNDFSTQTEVSGLPKFGPELIDAGAIRLRFLIGETYKFLPPDDLFEKILVDVAYANRFHPVRDWLDGLKWDGVPRIDNWLRDYAGAEDTAFNRAVGRIFLIAGVRRVRQPGCKFDTMIVLESPQGKNKSSAARILAVRDEWFTDNLPLDANSKEVIEQLSGIWIAEFAELTGMGRRESRRVKSFLSRQIDRARPAYGRRSESVPRQFVAVGSSNDKEYLDDDENRRYWPLRIIKFDLEKLKRDVPQLWAEAAHYESEGQVITLQEDLWTVAAEIQSERKILNPYVDKLRNIFGERNGWIASNEVWERLGVPIERRTGQAKRVGQAMRELGFELKRAKRKDEREGLERDARYYERGDDQSEFQF
jgi:hypothetical protein